MITRLVLFFVLASLGWAQSATSLFSYAFCSTSAEVDLMKSVGLAPSTYAPNCQVWIQDSNPTTAGYLITISYLDSKGDKQIATQLVRPGGVGLPGGPITLTFASVPIDARSPEIRVDALRAFDSITVK